MGQSAYGESYIWGKLHIRKFTLLYGEKNSKRLLGDLKVPGIIFLCESTGKGRKQTGKEKQSRCCKSRYKIRQTHSRAAKV
jgi:hypothetical protein